MKQGTLILGFLAGMLAGCGGLEQSEHSELSQLTIDHCPLAEGLGYIDPADESAALEECKTEMLRLFDHDGNGELQDQEIIESNDYIFERQQIRTEVWAELGLDDAQGKSQEHSKRMLMRQIVREVCDQRFDQSGSLSGGELADCRDIAKLIRSELRDSTYCDRKSQCHPVRGKEFKKFLKDRTGDRDQLIRDADLNGDGSLTRNELQAGAKRFMELMGEDLAFYEEQARLNKADEDISNDYDAEEANENSDDNLNNL